jgi:sn-glycerol 3-phosphate transport system permease protein
MRRARAVDLLLQRWARRLPAYAVLIVCAAIVLVPLYAAIVDSLHPIGEFLSDPPPSIWPSDPQWSNYFSHDGAAGAGSPLKRYLFNSVVVSLVITLGQLVTSVLAAYAFAYLRFPGRSALFALFLATMMVPLEVAIIPNFQTMQWLDPKLASFLPGTLTTIDGYPGLALPFLATGFGTFLLRQYFLTIPSELRDAAEMDGYGHFRFLMTIVVPLSLGAIATLAVFAFIQAWNQYLWPLLVTNDPDMRTVQIGIGAETQQLDKINVAFASTIVSLIPMLLLVVAFQRVLVRGIFGGALKG